jgi:cytidyltransferase-like protein
VKVFANFPHEAPPEPEYRVVTVGVFDGVHRGHQRILKRTIEVADGMPVALVTFDPHPRAVLGPPKRARLLSPLRERLQLLGTWPLAAVVVLRFDQAIAQLSYREFVRQALVERLGARRLVLGYNVAFGHERQGNRDSLAALGAEIGYAVDFIEAVEHEGEPVSSTRIRHCLDGGDVAGAAALLGRAYELEGTVVRGWEPSTSAWSRPSRAPESVASRSTSWTTPGTSTAPGCAWSSWPGCARRSASRAARLWWLRSARTATPFGCSSRRAPTAQTTDPAICCGWNLEWSLCWGDWLCTAGPGCASFARFETRGSRPLVCRNCLQPSRLDRMY